LRRLSTTSAFNEELFTLLFIADLVLSQA